MSALVPPALRTPIPSFKDTGKATNDILTKGFPSSLKFELTTSSENGVKFVTSAERLLEKDGKPYILASFQPKVELKEKGIVANATLDSKKLAGDIALSDFLSKGLKFTVRGTTNGTQELGTDVEFRNEKMAATLGLSLKDSTPKIEGSLVVGNKGFSAGALVGYKLAGGNAELDSVILMTNYITPNKTFDVVSTLKGTPGKTKINFELGMKLLYTHDSSNLFAVEVAYDPNRAIADGFGLTLVGQRKLDSITTGKAKVVSNTKNKSISFAIAQKINSNTTVTIGTEFDFVNPDSNPKIGFLVAFAP